MDGGHASASPVEAHPVRRIAIIVGCVIVAGAFANLVGWDIRGWFNELWNTLNDIALEYVVAAVVTITFQTTAIAYAWYSILRYAYPRQEVRWLQIYAAYAAAVGLNNILPANLGTIVMFVMLTTVIASATFVGVVSGYLVEKIFFTVAGTFTYLYLFLSVPGSFDISFDWIKENPLATALLVAGGVFVVVLVIRSVWPRVSKWWGQAKQGGHVLAHPRAFWLRVLLPEFLGWAAGLVVIAIFLAAYAIPVTFHTVMAVAGGNSVANTVSVTPGGVGVTQAFNVASLNGVTDSQTATAYSVAQQLVTTAWTLLMAIVLLIWAFGWAGGKTLVQESYEQARQKVEEQKVRKAASGAEA